MLIGHTKRPTEHKRHLLSVLGILDSYLRNDRRQFTVFAGKASCEIEAEKNVVMLVHRVGQMTGMCKWMQNYNV